MIGISSEMFSVCGFYGVGIDGSLWQVWFLIKVRLADDFCKVLQDFILGFLW